MHEIIFQLPDGVHLRPLTTPLVAATVAAVTRSIYHDNVGYGKHCRGRKVLENRNVNDEERIVQLEKELEETIMLGEESDRKFEEVTLDRSVK